MMAMSECGTVILEEFEDFGDFSKKMRELHKTRMAHGYSVKQNQNPHQMSISIQKELSECTL